MTGEALSAETLRRYVLGDLPDPERELVERVFLADEDVFQELVAVEEELYHDYAQGALDAAERSRFAERFLATAQGRVRLERARELLAALAATSQARPSSRWRWTALAVAAAAVLSLIVVWRTLVAPPRRDASAGAETAALATPAAPGAAENGLREPPAVPDPTAKPALPVDPAEPSTRAFVQELALVASLTRGDGDMPTVHLGEKAEVLRLLLELAPRSEAPTPATYDAEVRSAAGDVVWSSPALSTAPSTGASRVAIDVPARLLPENDYEVLLSRATPTGREPVADYVFRALRP